MALPTDPVYATYHELGFRSEDSPRIVDFFSELCRPANHILIVCDGPGDIILSGQHLPERDLPIQSGESVHIEDMPIRAIRLVWSGEDSSYRILAL